MDFHKELKDFLGENKGKPGSYCNNCGKIVLEKVGRCPRCRTVMRHYIIGQGYQPK